MAPVLPATNASMAFAFMLAAVAAGGAGALRAAIALASVVAAKELHPESRITELRTITESENFHENQKHFVSKRRYNYENAH